jgi:integrase
MGTEVRVSDPDPKEPSMARPRTNLPWIERRGAQHRAYWRRPQGGKTYEAFTSRRDAESFRELVALVGLDTARAIVRGELTLAPAEQLVTDSVDVVPEPVRAGNRTGVCFDDLAARFLTDLTGVETKTREGYTAQIEHYLRPFFAGTDIGLILAKTPLRTPVEPYLTVTGWVSWMNEQTTHTNDGRRTDKPVSAKLIRNVHGLLYSILDTAVDGADEGVLIRNPCQGTKLPADLEAERVFLEWRQVRYLLEAMPEHWRALVLFLVLTGARYGEAAGLTVGHCHLDPATGEAYVDIVRALRWEKGAGRVLGRLKSRTSRRRVYLPHGLVPELLPLLEGRSAEELVFRTPTGQPLHHSNFTQRVLLPALNRARLIDPSIPLATRIHAFRHTHAALLASAGHSTRVIKERLGHANITTTDRIYGHLTEDATVATLASLDQLMASVVTDAHSQLVAVTAEHADLPDPAGADLPEIDSTDEEDLAA